MTEDNIVKKVQALLAKAESTEFAEEAETFFAKAQELMTRHAIDEARLRAAATGIRETPLTISFVYSSNDANIPSKRALLQVIAEANGVKPIFHPTPRSKKDYTVSAVGFKSDLDFVQLLFASAMMQCARDARRQGLTKAQTTGFMMGFAHGVKDRLHRTEEEVVAKEPGTALVLASRVDDVNAAFKAAFPSTTKIASRWSDNTRYGAGQKSGRNADLSGGRGQPRVAEVASPVTATPAKGRPSS